MVAALLLLLCLADSPAQDPATAPWPDFELEINQIP